MGKQGKIVYEQTHRNRIGKIVAQCISLCPGTQPRDSHGDSRRHFAAKSFPMQSPDDPGIDPDQAVAENSGLAV